MDWTYKVELRRESDGTFGAYAPAMRDAIAGASKRAEALAEMRAALDAAVRGRIAFGMDLDPPPALDPDEGGLRVTLEPSLAAKASVYSAWKASGLSKVAFAARLGVNEKEGRRILDPNYPSGLDRLAQAARSLGYSLTVGATKTAEA